MCTKMHNPVSDQIRRAILDRMSAENIGARRFEETLGLKKWALRGILDPERKQAPSVDRAKEIVEALGLEFYIGPARDKTGTVTLNSDEFAALPLYAVEASAGSGAEVEAEPVDGHLAFRRDWLRRHGIAEGKARLLRARGDSMAPLISPGDLLMIDTARTEPRIDPGGRHRQMFVLRDEDNQLRVKWVYRLAERSVILVSENIAEFPPEAHSAAALVYLGQVVWWGHAEAK